jgi:hypothetical protein
MPKRPIHAIKALTGSYRQRFGAAAALLAVVSVGTATLASSAQLIVTPRTLTAVTTTGGAFAPGTVITSDSFSGTGNLPGQATSSGATWVKSGGGNWQVNGSTVSTTGNSPGASVVVNAAMLNYAAFVTITPLSTTPTPGLTFNNDGTNMMVVEYTAASSGTLRLFTLFGGTKTAVATATGIGPIGTPFVLKATSNGPNITIATNGTTRISYTLTGTNACLAKHIGCAGDGTPNTGVGLWADRDSSSTFSAFRVEAV